MPKAYPKEFRQDVIAVARRGDQSMSTPTKPGPTIGVTPGTPRGRRFNVGREQVNEETANEGYR